tara:strand:- start:9769 stop:9918 length:150 start_codon:yes stop_codon:yes gene_type:complete
MQFNFVKIYKSLKILKRKITFFVAFCDKLAHSNGTVRKVLADLRKETKQ